MTSPAWPRKGSHDHLPEGMVKLSRAADILGLDRRTVRRYGERGWLDVVHGGHKTAVLVTIASLRRFEAGEYGKPLTEKPPTVPPYGSAIG